MAHSAIPTVIRLNLMTDWDSIIIISSQIWSSFLTANKLQVPYDLDAYRGHVCNEDNIFSTTSSSSRPSTLSSHDAIPSSSFNHTTHGTNKDFNIPKEKLSSILMILYYCSYCNYRYYYTLWTFLTIYEQTPSLKSKAYLANKKSNFNWINIKLLTFT